MRSPLAVAVLALLPLASCDDKRQDKTTMQVLHVEQLGSQTDLELRYADCPGDARRILRLDASFAACAGPIKSGDKLPAELVSSWVSEKGAYRSDVVKLGACPVKLDPKEEANYEMIQVCSDVTMTGAVVGVRCDRTRSKELVAKCPWLRRK